MKHMRAALRAHEDMVLERAGVPAYTRMVVLDSPEIALTRNATLMAAWEMASVALGGEPCSS